MFLAVLAAIVTFAPAETPPTPAPAPPPGAEAPPAAAPATATPPAAAPKEDPVVCRNQVVAGSRLPVKVCMRRSDEEARKRSGQDALNKIQNSNGLRGPSS